MEGVFGMDGSGVRGKAREEICVISGRAQSFNKDSLSIYPVPDTVLRWGIQWWAKQP